MAVAKYLRWKLFDVWPVAMVASGLFTIPCFSSPSLFPFFLYSVALLVIVIVKPLLWSNSSILPDNNPASYLFLAWGIFVLVHGLFSNALLYRGYYIIVNVLLYLAFYRKGINKVLFFHGVSWLSFIEVVICSLQWMGLIQSQNNYFLVQAGSLAEDPAFVFLLLVCIFTHGS
jgi:hypothetical protein